MFLNNNAAEKERTAFWRDYESKIGETILAYCLGKCIKGSKDLNPPLWGLLIVSSGGFRFHHFPHENWFQAMNRASFGGEIPQEKTLYVSKERLLWADIKTEKSWWKSLLFPEPPLFLVRYFTEDGIEAELVAESDKKAAKLVEHIHELLLQ